MTNYHHGSSINVSRRSPGISNRYPWCVSTSTVLLDERNAKSTERLQPATPNGRVARTAARCALVAAHARALIRATILSNMKISYCRKLIYRVYLDSQIMTFYIFDILFSTCNTRIRDFRVSTSEWSVQHYNFEWTWRGAKWTWRPRKRVINISEK